MINYSVLILSTYPYNPPIHGGQQRLSNIATAYIKGGFKVIPICVYDENSYVRASRLDVAFPSDYKYRVFKGTNTPYMEDYLCGFYASENSGCLEQILLNLPKTVDAIHVEQPWLWNLAKKLRTHFNSAPLLILGTQNIETPLKRQIFNQFKIKNSEALQAIEDLENQAILEADLVLAVTSSDLEYVENLGGKRTLLAKNGISPWVGKENKINYWKNIFGASRFALFIASNHPPNYSGFIDYIGDSLGFIPPDSKLVVAGGVSDKIYEILMNSRWKKINESRLLTLGVLPKDDLDAIKDLAHLYILPIKDGGGSNIKTAEALFSGKSIVGSSPSFRGYEAYKDQGHISIFDSKKDFRSAITTKLMDSSSTTNISSFPELTWEYCLKDIPTTVHDLIKGRK